MYLPRWWSVRSKVYIRIEYIPSQLDETNFKNAENKFYYMTEKNDFFKYEESDVRPRIIIVFRKIHHKRASTAWTWRAWCSSLLCTTPDRICGPHRPISDHLPVRRTRFVGPTARDRIWSWTRATEQVWPVDWKLL